MAVELVVVPEPRNFLLLKELAKVERNELMEPIKWLVLDRESYHSLGLIIRGLRMERPGLVGRGVRLLRDRL